MRSRLSLLERAQTIKHLPVAEQVALLLELAQECSCLAEPIREALASQGGSVISIAVEGDDHMVVLLALIAAVAHDIATLPDSLLREEALRRHHAVAEGLSVRDNDARLMISWFGIVKDIMANQEVPEDKWRDGN